MGNGGRFQTYFQRLNLRALQSDMLRLVSSPAKDNSEQCSSIQSAYVLARIDLMTLETAPWLWPFPHMQFQDECSLDEQIRVRGCKGHAHFFLYFLFAFIVQVWQITMRYTNRY